VPEALWKRAGSILPAARGQTCDIAQRTIPLPPLRPPTAPLGLLPPNRVVKCSGTKRGTTLDYAWSARRARPSHRTEHPCVIKHQPPRRQSRRRRRRSTQRPATTVPTTTPTPNPIDLSEEVWRRFHEWRVKGNAASLEDTDGGDRRKDG
jgi:hypothetical protein